ncbi:MAG: hypothetical protein ACLT5U_12470 [Mediterraneibacter gnavus]
MKMKRWMAAGMAAMMTMSLVACGSSGEEKRKKILREKVEKNRLVYRFGMVTGQKIWKTLKKISTAKMKILNLMSRCRPAIMQIG